MWRTEEGVRGDGGGGAGCERDGAAGGGGKRDERDMTWCEGMRNRQAGERGQWRDKVG